MDGSGADPVAFAQGFYGMVASHPNKSPQRKPGDREPQGADPVACAQGFYGAGTKRVGAERCLKLEPNVIPPGGLESAGIVLGHRA